MSEYYQSCCLTLFGKVKGFEECCHNLVNICWFFCLTLLNFNFFFSLVNFKIREAWKANPCKKVFAFIYFYFLTFFSSNFKTFLMIFVSYSDRKMGHASKLVHAIRALSGSSLNHFFGIKWQDFKNDYKQKIFQIYH